MTILANCRYCDHRWNIYYINSYRKVTCPKCNDKDIALKEKQEDIKIDTYAPAIPYEVIDTYEGATPFKKKK